MKVNNANLCMNCDELFVGETCPSCLSHHYHPLRKWFHPLVSFEEIKEAKNVLKTSNNTIQEKSKGSIYSSANVASLLLYGSKLNIPSVGEGCQNDKAGSLSQADRIESSKSKVSESDNPCGK